jgi:hypothetical protein
MNDDRAHFEKLPAESERTLIDFLNADLDLAFTRAETVEIEKDWVCVANIGSGLFGTFTTTCGFTVRELEVSSPAYLSTQGGTKIDAHGESSTYNPLDTLVVQPKAGAAYHSSKLLGSTSSGDGDHPSARLKSPSLSETASVRLAGNSVCLCPVSREYGPHESTSRNRG